MHEVVQRSASDKKSTLSAHQMAVPADLALASHSERWLDPLSFWTVFSGCGSGRLLVAVALGLGLVAFGSVSVAPRSWAPLLFRCSGLRFPAPEAPRRRDTWWCTS